MKKFLQAGRAGRDIGNVLQRYLFWLTTEDEKPQYIGYLQGLVASTLLNDRICKTLKIFLPDRLSQSFHTFPFPKGEIFLFFKTDYRDFKFSNPLGIERSYRPHSPPVRQAGEIRNASRSLNTNGQFDEEGCPFGFVVTYPDISIVIGDDSVNDGQPQTGSAFFS